MTIREKGFPVGNLSILGRDGREEGLNKEVWPGRMNRKESHLGNVRFLGGAIPLGRARPKSLIKVHGLFYRCSERRDLSAVETGKGKLCPS
jgi:hypothetical protein